MQGESLWVLFRTACDQGDLLLQFVQCLQLALEFEQQFHFRADLSQVQFAVLADEHTLNITPVQVPPGKGFMHHQIFGRAGDQ